MNELIIFDFGNVIAEVDFIACSESFANFSEKLSQREIFRLLTSHSVARDIIDRFGRGLINCQEFYQMISDEWKLDLSLENFKYAWNKMIGNVNGELDEILEELSSKALLLLLSNTNIIHWRSVIKDINLVKKHFPDEEQLFLSFRTGQLKPTKVAFERAVFGSNMIFKEAVLVDDTVENIRVFNSLGGKSLQYDCRFDKLEKIKRFFI